MNPRSTWIWFGMAVALVAAIFVNERFLRKPPEPPGKLLPGLRPGAVTSVRVQPARQLEIRAERTNGGWHLTEPLSYPARPGSVETHVNLLGQLTPAHVITARELRKLPDADDQYGFTDPQATLVLQQDDTQYRIRVGHRTAPGDQVFLQIIGIPDDFVVDAELLRWIPANADAWRDTSLVNWEQLAYDRLVVTNAGKVLRLQRDSTNQLWRMLLPNDARADSERIEQALQRLHSIRARQFASDDAADELDAFGLQTPPLSLSFLQGTNTALLLAFGRSPESQPELAYARRDDQDTVVTVSREIFQPWLASASDDFRDFLDRHLLVLTRPPDAMTIRARDEFTLQRLTNNTWTVLPHNFPADTELVNRLISDLTGMQALRIEKDVVVDQDLPDYGLDSPTREYVFMGAETNALQFGTNRQDKIFARRAGEGFVYSVQAAEVLRLPSASWEMRDRRIWNFRVEDVARITIEQNGRQYELTREGTNQWSVAKGIIDQIRMAAIEETVHRLGDLSASFWVQRGDANLAQYGLTPEAYKLNIQLRNGRQLSVQFGGDAPSRFPYALVTLGDEPWVFEFPWAIYQYVLMYLTIPPEP